MDLNLREMREQLEDKILSPYAAKSSNSRGRLIEEAKCRVRTDFQRDRDRIIYSKAFRRLKHKTQVFIAPEGDHYITRLTHTLEVSQIARTIARGLNLNEDLTEAIALGHDLGHPPFGHAGEDALDKIYSELVPGVRFRHNEQSLRVVDCLEKGGGLNLTHEVRDGILKHTKGRFGKMLSSDGENPLTLEASVVRLSDRLAYINHDIDDAIRAKLIKPEELPGSSVKLFGGKTSERIKNMILDVIYSSWDKPEISMSGKCREEVEKLKDFMFERVYTGSLPKNEEKKAYNLIRELFIYFMKNSGELPPYLIRPELSIENSTDRARIVCDYLAGMTDHFALLVFSKIFIPRRWHL